LPGRETRSAETPFDSMPALIRALADAIQPYPKERFAFFGHSMGAIVAFELTRELRRRGQPQPAALIVSAARAPQFRLNWTPPPEPGERDFLDELRRLEGVPAAILENSEALRLVLPALRADARLYRNYIYMPAEPLDIPIVAYRGAADPNIRPEHIQP